jgi:hypothetical protein
MNLKRFLGIAVFFLALCAGAAATAADRSPFVQGHWWNPARAGNGFEFFNVGDSAMIIWYTYEESGRPVWYTAQGSAAAMGAEQWQILRHRWVDGVKVPGVVVGSLRIALGSYESATLTWNLGGSAGSWPIEPFRPSALSGVTDPDRTGSWFDSSNSGWGFSLTEQGDVFGGVLFTYDTAGEPTWAAGFGRVREVADLHTFEGACPSCAYRASVSRAAGRVTFDFSGDTQAVIHNQLTLPMAAGTNIDGATIVQLGRPASTRPADRPQPAPGSLFSFAEASGVGAPNSDAQLSVQRTGATSGAFDIYYTFQGPGCARNGTGGPVRFGDGDMGSKTVSVPMGAKGVCMVWLVPPPSPAGIGDQYATGITVVPVVAGCPAPSNVAYAELGGIGNPLLQMQRSGQTVFIPLPAPADGRVSGKVSFGESPGAYTPQPVTLEISISRCPGVIDADSQNRCNLHTSNGTFNAIDFVTQAYQILNSSTASRYGYCWAGDGGQYYINARWTFSSCAFGVAECGFAIQHNRGSF